jgi:hypothetical protein
VPSGQTNLYPDCANCDISSITETDAVVDECVACLNGFMYDGECVPKCPKQHFGLPFYTKRGILSTSTCECKEFLLLINTECDTSCFECIGY